MTNLSTNLSAERIQEGARNLLVNCAEVKKDHKVLLLHEDPALGWYDLEAPQAIARECHALGAMCTMMQVGGPKNNKDLRLANSFKNYDCIIFFARIGDQDRFSAPVPGKTMVMSYIRDIQMLASPFGRTRHQSMSALKEAINDELLNATQIEITCAHGTKFCGTTSPEFRSAPLEVGVRRFPVGVHVPIAARQFSGIVALRHFLTPTGSKVYAPSSLAIEQTAFAKIHEGRIVKFEGPDSEIQKIQAHYNTVADEFGLEWDIVHSWHAGIHPGLAYNQSASRNPDRWSNTAFTSPNYLHIHTCGAYAPGEISIMVHNPTVLLDGKKLWDKGRLSNEYFPKIQTCLESSPGLKNFHLYPAIEDGIAG